MHLTCLFTLFLGLLATAAPNSSKADRSPANTDKSLLISRQILTADPSVECCTDCADHYGPAKFQQTFTDLCTWAGKNLVFTSPATYYTGNYYCPAPFDDDVCMHLEIEYLCGAGGGDVTFLGCIGYFDYIVDPRGSCGGPPYPGARVESSDGCWTFQATADLLSQWTERDIEMDDVECDSDGRWCTHPGSNATVFVYPGPKHRFGPGHLVLGDDPRAE